MAKPEKAIDDETEMGTVDWQSRLVY